MPDWPETRALVAASLVVAVAASFRRITDENWGQKGNRLLDCLSEYGWVWIFGRNSFVAHHGIDLVATPRSHDLACPHDSIPSVRLSVF